MPENRRSAETQAPREPEDSCLLSCQVQVQSDWTTAWQVDRDSSRLVSSPPAALVRGSSLICEKLTLDCPLKWRDRGPAWGDHRKGKKRMMGCGLGLEAALNLDSVTGQSALLIDTPDNQVSWSF